MFVNRERELASLAAWEQEAGGRLGLVWGRRRVGKTALLQAFAGTRRTIFHTAAARPTTDELRILSRAAAAAVDSGLRDLEQRPFADWDDALETVATAARDEPLLLVLDEFPELMRVTPELPALLRAFWDRARPATQLKVLLCGSAVRTMEAMQREREPLYGRFDLSLLVHPFAPHEAAAMLPALDPSERALVYGIVGGIPLYLQWFDEGDSVRESLGRLAFEPGGKLLSEGQLVLATEGDAGDLAMLVLRAIAAGRTRHNEIEQAVRAEPGRMLERLVELRLVERMVPAGENPARTRRRLYRIADNFLAFWLGVLDRHRSAIERGLGETILPVVEDGLDDFMGERWEAAFREHLTRLARAGELGPEIVEIGRWWQDGPPVEIDAVALAGRTRETVLAGEAKWARRVSGARLRRELESRAARLPRAAADLRYAVAAREAVDDADDLLVVTAADVFGG